MDVIKDFVGISKTDYIINVMEYWNGGMMQYLVVSRSHARSLITQNHDEILDSRCRD
jgi:hypothetical protein